MNYCAYCDTKIVGKVKYCGDCGAKVGQSTHKSGKVSNVKNNVHETSGNILNYYFEIYVGTLRKYFEFSGRASRKEYWIFYLINLVIWMFLGWIFPDDSVVGLCYLFTLMPSISVGVRRMHDTGHSGLNLIVPIYNIVLLLSKGGNEENVYGNVPAHS